MNSLEEQDIVANETVAVLPPWLKQVAKHRAHFVDCAFAWQHEGTEVAYKFVFAMQNPGVLFFAPLQPADSYLGVTAAGCLWSHWPRRDYHVHFMNSRSSFFMHDVPEDAIVVIPGFRCLGGGLLRSTARSEPLPSVLSSLPIAPPVVARQASGSSDKTGTKLEPWAQELLDKRDRKLCKLPASLQEETEPQAAAELEEELYDDPAVAEMLAHVPLSQI